MLEYQNWSLIAVDNMRNTWCALKRLGLLLGLIYVIGCR